MLNRPNKNNIEKQAKISKTGTNRWSKYIDVKPLENNLKNCSCGKIIKMDLIKCCSCCSNILVPGLREYFIDSSSDDAAVDQYSNLNRNSNALDHASVDTGEYRPGFVPIAKDNTEHSVKIIQDNTYGDGNVRVVTGPEHRYENIDQMIKDEDFNKNSNKITKIFVKVREPRVNTSSYGPIRDLNFNIYNQSTLQLNKNANANTDEAIVGNERNALHLDRLVIDDRMKTTKKAAASRKFIPPAEVSSVEDFHSIKEAESVITLHRNNNADDSTEDLIADNNKVDMSVGSQYVYVPDSDAQQSIPRATSTAFEHLKRSKQSRKLQQQDSSSSDSLNNSLQEEATDGQPPNDPDDALIAAAIEEKPQKLTLNATIRLKIYQNEQGEIAVQQQPPSRTSSNINLQANVNTNAPGVSISQTTQLTGHTLETTSTTNIHGQHSSTYLNQPLTIEQKQRNLANKEALQRQGNYVTEQGTLLRQNPNTNNNSSNIIQCGTTKNIYMKQRRLSAINNKVLFYEEKEMQMSETSTLLSDQESINDYNYQQYPFYQRFQRIEKNAETRACQQHKYN